MRSPHPPKEGMVVRLPKGFWIDFALNRIVVERRRRLHSSTSGSRRESS